ncbi:MAG: hypothetical protein WC421_01555 [Elusimicrobiales bacterium]
MRVLNAENLLRLVFHIAAINLGVNVEQGVAGIGFVCQHIIKHRDAPSPSGAGAQSFGVKPANHFFEAVAAQAHIKNTLYQNGFNGVNGQLNFFIPVDDEFCF